MPTGRRPFPPTAVLTRRRPISIATSEGPSARTGDRRSRRRALAVARAGEPSCSGSTPTRSGAGPMTGRVPRVDDARRASPLRPRRARAACRRAPRLAARRPLTSLGASPERLTPGLPAPLRVGRRGHVIEAEREAYRRDGRRLIATLVAYPRCRTGRHRRATAPRGRGLGHRRRPGHPVGIAAARA